MNEKPKYFTSVVLVSPWRSCKSFPTSRLSFRRLFTSHSLLLREVPLDDHFSRSRPVALVMNPSSNWTDPVSSTHLSGWVERPSFQSERLKYGFFFFFNIVRLPIWSLHRLLSIETFGTSSVGPLSVSIQLNDSRQSKTCVEILSMHT